MMHYSWNAFGKNQQMTIQTLDPSQQYEIGQGNGFSNIDVEQLNKLYNCSKLNQTIIHIYYIKVVYSIVYSQNNDESFYTNL